MTRRESNPAAVIVWLAFSALMLAMAVAYWVASR